MKKIVALLCLALLLVSFAGEAFVPCAYAQEELDVSAEAAAMSEAPEAACIVLQPEHPGDQEKSCDVAVVDYSNTTDGYVMACYTGETSKRLKLRVQGPKTTYTYNLPIQNWTTFPLSDGDGSYQVSIYRNTSGNKYATVMSAKFKVSLSDEFAPFLRPNQYVDYSASPETMTMGAQLCTGIEKPLEKVAAVYDYVVSNFSYDYDKAATVKSGYLPVLILCLQKRRASASIMQR